MLPAPRGAALRLATLGFTTLFLELALIRYLAGTVWNLGYFPNLVLLAAFLGMGLGFLVHSRLSEEGSRRALGLAAPLLLALVGLVPIVRPAVPGFGLNEGSVGGELFFTSTVASTQGPVPFLFCFGAVVLLFVLVSQRTAKLFLGFPPLRAYTLDIAGSCAGIVAFMIASAAQLPAWCWFALLAVAALIAGGDQAPARRQVAALVLLAAAFVVKLQDGALLGDPSHDGAREVHWSPYQRVELKLPAGAPPVIYVNGIGHQVVLEPGQLRRSFYRYPLLDRRARGVRGGERVLVIGAGSGNDVAAALSLGAGHVHAVEIDPVLAEIGRRHHPARPYDDPRVLVTVDDGRAVMSRASEQYDLIVFALTDSLVKVSPMAQLRLENYLFTRESVERAWGLLAPGGDLCFYNFYRQEWLLERLRGLIVSATGHAPREIYRRADFVELLVTKGASPPAVADAAMPIASDDWPFPYLERPGIPPLYVKGMLVYLVVLAPLAWWIERRQAGQRATKLAFLVMGAAFLLLETKSVVQFSLLFGTTWYNASLVFLGVLGLVLLANLTVSSLGERDVFVPAYVLLMASCAASLFVPLSSLLAVEMPAARALLACLLTFSPIYFANLLFSSMFREQSSHESMFGWNLLGAALGGVGEYAAMAVGYRALGIVVAIAYTATFALFRLGRRAR